MSTPPLSTSPLQTAPPRNKKNLGWLWYFLTLIVLAVSATVILIVYNEKQQLRPEQLAAAQEQWRDHGPADYRLVYQIKVNDSASEFHIDSYEVTVRGGAAVGVLKNGRPQPAARLAGYGMDKLLALAAGNMELDRTPGRRRSFTRGFFDANNGALLWYVRRVMRSSERMEITVEKMDLLAR